MVNSHGQERSPVMVCVVADLKMPLTENTIDWLYCEVDAQSCPLCFSFCQATMFEGSMVAWWLTLLPHSKNTWL